MQYFVRVEPYELPERVKQIQQIREGIGSSVNLTTLALLLYLGYGPGALVGSVLASTVSVLCVDSVLPLWP